MQNVFKALSRYQLGVHLPAKPHCVYNTDAAFPYAYLTHTHTHPFNSPFSGTTRVSRYQKGKTYLDFTEARDSEWQWHPLGHMQVCAYLCLNILQSVVCLCVCMSRAKTVQLIKMPFVGKLSLAQETTLTRY